MGDWYQVKNESRIMTPSVLIYPDRVGENIRQMIAIAGNPERLRPHVKTHKMPPIVKMQLEAGITKFKCATLAEMAMVARAGGKDILLSYPLVGPGVNYFCKIMQKFPATMFSVVADSFISCRELELCGRQNKLRISVFVDIDNGMHRTGIIPGREAADLVSYIYRSENLYFRGFHIYDGHTRESGFEKRREMVESDIKPVVDFISGLMKEGIPVEEVVCGGSPSFPVHALTENRILSPGTTLLWDEGYGAAFGDIGILPAAVVAARVISKPLGRFLCLDLGHKAIASEKPHPRVKFFGISEYNVENHSEEHLVISTPDHEGFSIGQVIYGIPLHICPTIALHDQVYVVRNGMVVRKWKVAGRSRIY